jgi:hypothetical protein
MAKEFYTERDIEDLVKRGILALEMHENVVLTEVAYEKARTLGMKLVRGSPENPPSAPVRPYLSQKQAKAAGAPAAQPAAAAAAAHPAAAAPKEIDLQQRIRDAVAAQLGTQVDPSLLDVIIRRVLAGTGVK